jgi:hypothetical protein
MENKLIHSIIKENQCDMTIIIKGAGRDESSVVRTTVKRYQRRSRGLCRAATDVNVETHTAAALHSSVYHEW